MVPLRHRQLQLIPGVTVVEQSPGRGDKHVAPRLSLGQLSKTVESCRTEHTLSVLSTTFSEMRIEHTAAATPNNPVEKRRGEYLGYAVGRIAAAYSSPVRI
jgi:hypothetical protein